MYYVTMVKVTKNGNINEKRECFATIDKAKEYLMRNRTSALYGYISDEDALECAEDVKRACDRDLERQLRAMETMLNGFCW